MSLKTISTKEATQVKIEPKTQSYFNIDGEIYENDHVTVEHLTGFLNLFGEVYPL